MRLSDWSSDVCSSDLYRQAVSAVRLIHGMDQEGRPNGPPFSFSDLGSRRMGRAQRYPSRLFPGTDPGIGGNAPIARQLAWTWPSRPLPTIPPDICAPTIRVGKNQIGRAHV